MKRKLGKIYLPIYRRLLLCIIMMLVGVFMFAPNSDANPGPSGVVTIFSNSNTTHFSGSCNMNIHGNISCNTNNPYLEFARSFFGVQGFENYCPKNLSMGDSQGLHLVSRIVPCVRGLIQATGEKFVSGFYILIQPFIQAMLLLAVVLFGVLILAQGFIEKLSRDTFVFVLKIGGILWATQNITGLTELMLIIMDGFLDIVNSKIGLPGVGSINVINDYSNFDAETIRCSLTDHMWVRLDCMIDIIVGINATGSLADGMLAFFFSSFISGSMGMLIGAIGLYFSINILLGILNTAYIYLMAVATIILLFMIAGLIIPLILFKNTFEFYRKWLNILMATILQPIIVFAFLNVALIAFDIIIYSGESSIMRSIAGNDAIDDDFNLNDYLEENDLLRTDGIGFNLDFKEVVFQSGGALPHRGMDGSFPSNIHQQSNVDRGRATSGGIDTDPSDTQVHFPYKAIDWEKMAQLRDVTKLELMKTVAAAFVMAGLASFVLISFLRYVPNLTVGLAGGAYVAPVFNGGNSASQGLRAGASRAVDNVGSKVTNLVTGRR